MRRYILERDVIASKNRFAGIVLSVLLLFGLIGGIVAVSLDRIVQAAIATPSVTVVKAPTNIRFSQEHSGRIVDYTNDRYYLNETYPAPHKTIGLKWDAPAGQEINSDYVYEVSGSFEAADGSSPACFLDQTVTWLGDGLPNYLGNSRVGMCGDGIYSFSVKLVNRLTSDKSDSITRKITYDHTVPQTTITVSPVINGKFTVSGDASDNIQLSRVYVQLVSRSQNIRCGGTTIDLIPFGNSHSWSASYDMASLKQTGPTGVACLDGSYAAHVAVVDMAGNSSTAGWTDDFYVDSTAPVVTSVSLDKTINVGGLTYASAAINRDNSGNLTMTIETDEPLNLSKRNRAILNNGHYTDDNTTYSPWVNFIRDSSDLSVNRYYVKFDLSSSRVAHKYISDARIVFSLTDNGGNRGGYVYNGDNQPTVGNVWLGAKIVIDNKIPEMQNLKMFVYDNGDWVEKSYVKPGDKVRTQAEAIDTGSMVDYVEFRIKNKDGGGYIVPLMIASTSVGDNVYQYDFEIPDDGLYYDTHNPISEDVDGLMIWARAYDIVGNYGNGINTNGLTVDFTFDNTPPSVPTNLSWRDSHGTVFTTSGVLTNSYSGTAVWQSSDSNVDHYIYKYWNNISTSSYSDQSHPWVLSRTATSYSGVFNQGEGSHYFCVVAVDAVGNESDCSEPFEIIYDKTAPVVAIVSAIDNGDGTYTISGTTDDSADVNVSVDGNPIGGPITPESGNWQVIIGVLTGGTYNVTAESTDDAGNAGVAVLDEFTVVLPPSDEDDSQAPAGGDTSGVQGVSTSTNPSSFSASGAAPNRPTSTSRSLAASNPSQRIANTEGEDVLGDQTESENSEDSNAIPSTLAESVSVSEDGTKTEDNDECTKFLSICWYYWIPVAIIIVGVIYYIYRRSSDKNTSSSSL